MEKITLKKLGGYQFKDSNDESVILYSKISLIDDIFSLYEDLSLDVMDVSSTKSDDVDYSKLEFYIDKSVYLDNDVIYVDEMMRDKNIISYSKNDLITMFSFIYCELKSEMEEEVDDLISDLAKDFARKYLTLDQRLFDEFGFKSTIIALKDILHKIDKEEPYKDQKYWEIFIVIEKFLYGSLNLECSEDGVFWGINNFWQIWEDMCNTYRILECKKDKEEIFFADTSISIDGFPVANSKLKKRPIFIKENWTNPFYVEFRGNKRYLRPDLIIQNNIENIFDRWIGVKIKKEYVSILGAQDKSIDLEIYSKTSDSLLFFESFCRALKSKSKSSRSQKSGTAKQSLSIYAYPLRDFEEIKKNYLAKLERSHRIFYIIDWKYVDESFFLQDSERLKEASTKQLCYEFCLKSSSGFSTKIIRNQMGYPSYFNNEDQRYPFLPANLDFKNNSQGEFFLEKNGLELYKVNFVLMQEVYLKNAEK